LLGFKRKVHHPSTQMPQLNLLRLSDAFFTFLWFTRRVATTSRKKSLYISHFSHPRNNATAVFRFNSAKMAFLFFTAEPCLEL